MKIALYLLALACGSAHAFSPSAQGSNSRSSFVLNAKSNDRRAFLSSAIASAAASCLLLPAQAADGEELVEVYFASGCFWHAQHEFVEAERKYLGRKDDALTARVGYAGGRGGMADGKVCYHNAKNVAYYGELGHAEVVSVKIPPSAFKDFAVEYCKLFKNGLRPDQAGDRGLEYRNLVGFKGGSKSPFAQELVEASKATGDQLDFAVGKGSDADTPRLVWIMDTEKYPFYVGEQYHQFHDGFNFGENYPDAYNGLASKFGKAGENFGACPNGSLNLGFGGL